MMLECRRLPDHDSKRENRQKQEAIMKRILTIKQAAQLIEGLTEYRIRQMCKTGQLRSFKAGNKYLIAEEDLYETVFGRRAGEEDKI
jgi:excisionase family DNA binding protein